MLALIAASSQTISTWHHHGYYGGGWGGGFGLGLGLGLGGPYLGVGYPYGYYPYAGYVPVAYERPRTQADAQISDSYQRRKAINAQIVQLQSELDDMQEQLEDMAKNGANPNSPEIQEHKRKMEKHQKRIDNLRNQLATV